MQLGWAKRRTQLRFLILAVMLAALAGCATSSKVKTTSGSKASSVAERSSVERLGDGREGFVILEVPNSDAGMRSDFERAVLLMERGDYSTAIPLLEGVIKGAPGVTPPYINLAIAYMQLGKLAEAEPHLKKALQLLPAHPVASNEYGLLLRKSGRFVEARTIYEKTLSSFPDYYPAHRNLGILCDIYLNDLACALEHYEIYSAAMPEDEAVKIWVADMRLRLGR
jgi:tetratricopeptide (TPR) repeat protein